MDISLTKQTTIQKVEYWFNKIFRSNIRLTLSRFLDRLERTLGRIKRKSLTRMREGAYYHCHRNNIKYLIQGHTHHKGYFQYEDISIYDGGDFVNESPSYITISPETGIVIDKVKK
jgi:UDP-2,3-diacylglucosamine pyrophosphatase LpxH